MYKPSPQALKSVMLVKPQGSSYETESAKAEAKARVARIVVRAVSSDDDSSVISHGANQKDSQSIPSTPIKSSPVAAASSPASSSVGSTGAAGLFADRKDSKPMPMNARRSVALPKITRRKHKKSRSATMLRRTGSQESHFSTDDAMSVDNGHSRSPVPARRRPPINRSRSVDEEKEDEQQVPVKDIIPRSHSPFSHLSDDISLPSSSRQEELLKEQQEKMAQLEWQMQQQMQEQERKHAALQQRVMEQEQLIQSHQSPHSSLLTHPSQQQQQQRHRPVSIVTESQPLFQSQLMASRNMQQPQSQQPQQQQEQVTGRTQQHLNQVAGISNQQQPLPQNSNVPQGYTQSQQTQNVVQPGNPQQPQPQQQPSQQTYNQPRQPQPQPIFNGAITGFSQQQHWLPGNQAVQPQPNQLPTIHAVSQEHHQQQSNPPVVSCPPDRPPQPQQQQQEWNLAPGQPQQQRPNDFRLTPSHPNVFGGQQQQQQQQQRPPPPQHQQSTLPSAQSSHASTGYLSARQQDQMPPNPQQQQALAEQTQHKIATAYDEKNQWNQMVGGPPQPQHRQQAPYPAPSVYQRTIPLVYQQGACPPPSSPSPSQWSQSDQIQGDYRNGLSVTGLPPPGTSQNRAAPQGYPGQTMQQNGNAQKPTNDDTSDWLASLTTQLVVHQPVDHTQDGQRIPQIQAQPSLSVSNPHIDKKIPPENRLGAPIAPTQQQNTTPDPVYARALEDLWSQVEGNSVESTQQPQQVHPVSPHAQQPRQVQPIPLVTQQYPPNNQTWQETPPTSYTQQPANPTIRQQGQTLQSYPYRPVNITHQQQPEGSRPMPVDSERTNHSRGNDSAYNSAYSYATQPHSNVHFRQQARAPPPTVPPITHKQTDESESAFSDMPFGTGALPPGSTRQILGQYGNNIGDAQPRAAEPAMDRRDQQEPPQPRAQHLATEVAVRGQAMDREQRQGSTEAREHHFGTATAAVASSRPNNRKSIATESNNHSKGSRLLCYTFLCLVLVLLTGGGTVVALYFFTDLFDNDDDSSAAPYQTFVPTLSPSVGQNIAPPVQVTPSPSLQNATGGPSAAIGDYTGDDFGGDVAGNELWDTSNTSWVNFTIGGFDEILSSPTATLVPTNGSSLAVNGSIASNVNILQSFEWLPTKQEIASTEPDAMVGSFLAINRKGSVLVVGSSSNTTEPTIAYRMNDDAETPLPLGLPFTLSSETTAFVSAALSADGSILALGVNDGSVKIFDFDADEEEWSQRAEDILLTVDRIDGAMVSVSLSADGRILAASVLDTESGVLIVQPFVFEAIDSAWKPIGDKVQRKGRPLAGSVTLSANGLVLAFVQVFSLGDMNSTRGTFETMNLNIFGNTSSVEKDSSQVFVNVTDMSAALSAEGNKIVVTNDKLSVVYNYSTEAETWNKQSEFLRGGSSVSISDNGLLVVIGDPDAVVTYEYIDMMWQQHHPGQQELSLNNGEDGSGFGSAQALAGDGSVLAIGAPMNDEGAENSGKVILFEATEM